MSTNESSRNATREPSLSTPNTAAGIEQKKTDKKKLPRLPETHRIRKRPALRPAIPSPYSSAQKVVYVKRNTPFVAALKRVQKLLALVQEKEEKKRTASAHGGDAGADATSSGGKGTGKAKAKGNGKGEASAAAAAAVGTDDEEGAMVKKKEDKEEVLLKGTGKAIERVLQLGLWFERHEQKQKQKRWRVRVRTGEVFVVDDVERVVEQEDEQEEGDAMEGLEGEEREEGEEKDKDKNKTELEAVVPETRLRRVSMLEVGVSWR